LCGGVDCNVLGTSHDDESYLDKLAVTNIPRQCRYRSSGVVSRSEFSSRCIDGAVIKMQAEMALKSDTGVVSMLARVNVFDIAMLLKLVHSIAPPNRLRPGPVTQALIQEKNQTPRSALTAQS
jgi:hypothetical protein